MSQQSIGFQYDIGSSSDNSETNKQHIATRVADDVNASEFSRQHSKPPLPFINDRTHDEMENRDGTYHVLDSNTNCLESAPASAKYVWLKNHAVMEQYKYAAPYLSHSEMLRLYRPLNETLDSTAAMNADKLHLVGIMSELSHRGEHRGTRRLKKERVTHVMQTGRSYAPTRSWTTTASSSAPVLVNPLMHSQYASPALVTPRLEATDQLMHYRTLHAFGLQVHPALYLYDRFQRSIRDSICWPSLRDAQKILRRDEYTGRLVSPKTAIGFHQELFTPSDQLPEGSLFEQQRLDLISPCVQQLTAEVDHGAVKWRDDTVLVQRICKNEWSADPLRAPPTAVLELFRSRLHHIDDSRIRRVPGEYNSNFTRSTYQESSGKRELLQRAMDFIQIPILHHTNATQFTAELATGSKRKAEYIQDETVPAAKCTRNVLKYEHLERTAARHMEAVSDAVLEMVLKYLEPYVALLFMNGAPKAATECEIGGKELFHWEHILRCLISCGRTAPGGSYRVHSDLPHLPLSQALIERVQCRLFGLYAGGTVVGPPQHSETAVLEPENEIFEKRSRYSY